MPVDTQSLPSIQPAALPVMQRSDPSQRIEIPIVTKSPRCPKATGDEIVVCAIDPEIYRMRPIKPPGSEDAYEPGIRLGDNTTIAQTLEQASVGGWSSNRVMVKMKIKF